MEQGVVVRARKKSLSKSGAREYPKGSVKSANAVLELAPVYQARLPLEATFHTPKQVERLDIEGKLSQLLDLDLTFKGEKTSYATHNLHAFAAKFPPQLPRLFIDELTFAGEWVLDPMAGSGTALVEAILAGRHAAGIDLDPLAILVSRVKTTSLDLPACSQIGNEALRKARSRMPDIAKQLSTLYSFEELEFLHYWFEPHIIYELLALVLAIKTVKEAEVRAFLQVVFSSIIITKSGGVTRARDLAHSRPHRVLGKKASHSALETFRKRLHTAIESLSTIAGATERAIVACADATALPLRDNSVQLIITSPPYAANAIDYVRAHKFSLVWFGHQLEALRDLRRKYIGAELRSPNLEFPSETANRVVRALHRKDNRRAAVVAHYFHHMELALREMLRVLARGRAAVLVVGSSRIRDIEIEAPAVLAEIAESIGFKLVGVANREIARDARMMPVSRNSAKKGIEARMHQEGVIGLVK